LTIAQEERGEFVEEVRISQATSRCEREAARYPSGNELVDGEKRRPVEMRESFTVKQEPVGLAIFEHIQP